MKEKDMTRRPCGRPAGKPSCFNPGGLPWNECPNSQKCTRCCQCPLMRWLPWPLFPPMPAYRQMPVWC